MVAISNALEIIPSSPKTGGSKRGDWKKAGVFLAKKTCGHCGADFRPWINVSNGAVVSYMKPGLWEKQRFCSISCSKKSENAMRDTAAREKMVATLRRIGHQPKVRGGNGRGPTVAQNSLLKALGQGWTLEHAIPTKMPRGSGYPTNYKIDIAHIAHKIAIEVDGNTHSGKRIEEDFKKFDLLTDLGWRVLHVTNAQAIQLCSTCRSVDTLLSSLMES